MLALGVVISSARNVRLLFPTGTLNYSKEAGVNCAERL